MSSDENARLEFETIVTTYNHNDSLIYTGSGLFLTASVAGLALLARASGATTREHVVATGLAAVGISFVVVVWQLWLDRIFSYNRVRAYRLRELEAQLGMYSHRYITSLDSPESARLEPERLEQLQALIPSKSHLAFWRPSGTVRGFSRFRVRTALAIAGALLILSAWTIFFLDFALLAW